MKKLLFLTFTLCIFIMNASAQQGAKKLLPAYDENRGSIPLNPVKIKGGKGLTMPADLVVPGEFEETKAVLIAWPYPSSANSQYCPLYASLMDAIQNECELWILIDDYSDSNQVISYMSINGTTLTNHLFLQKETNAFWVRDYGPWGFYYSNNDSLGFVDLKYYSSRPKDDVVPEFLANYLGIPNYKTTIKMEGGNFFTDGFGYGFYSSRIAQNNYSWSTTMVHDTISNIFNLSDFADLTTLVCDGGTGHIDMYCKLFDEQTFIITKYPSVVTASDKTTIENNVLILQTLTSTYGRPFKIHRMDMPTQNNGNYSISCAQIDNDARGYINGLMLNKSFLLPIYSNATTGNVAGDSVAIERFKSLLPGYNIVPIDARLLTPWGGAIHCITKEIPADNPIRFWHPSIEGYQQLNTSYHLVAKIKNKTGISSAYCYWRKKGATSWNTVSLSDSSGYFIGDITNSSFSQNDTIQYYLEATSNNSKTMTKPIVAPNGYYYFFFQQPTGGKEVFADYPKNHLFSAYPNPATDKTKISFYLTNPASAVVKISDITGRLMDVKEISNTDKGMNEVNINTSSYSHGIYLYSLYINGTPFKTRKFMVVK